MKGFNTVAIGGNLTRDPELRMAGSTPVLQMSVAVNDSKKNAQTGEWGDVPNFFDVIVFGAYADALSQHLQKGMKVAIHGKLRWNQWENADGEKRSKVEIVADQVMTMSSLPSSYTKQGSYAAPAPSSEILTEDIPF